MPENTREEDRGQYTILSALLKNVVLFMGTHCHYDTDLFVLLGSALFQNGLRHPQRREQHMRSLRSVSLAKFAWFHWMFSFNFCMGVRLTKNMLGPEWVQEAVDEVAGIGFYPEERLAFLHETAFARSRRMNAWGLCGRLPLNMEGIGDCTEDCTGLRKLGVWHVALMKDDSELPAEPASIKFDHLRVKRPKMEKTNQCTGQVMPAAPDQRRCA